MNRNIILTIAISILATSACVEYHPYDTRIEGKRDINAKNISRIKSACRGRKSIRFAVISDTQRWYDETRDAVDALTARNDIDFVIHAGDISDFGIRSEFERQRDILEHLDVPYVVTLGNHDCLATGKIIFEKIFGAFNFTFDAGDVRFIVLNTNTLEFDNEENVPNLQFIDDNNPKSASSPLKSVAVMHCKPFCDQFDNDIAHIFHEKICQYPSLQFCINGHEHKVECDDLFGDGIIYYQCANIEQRSYLIFEIDEKGYKYEVVEF